MRRHDKLVEISRREFCAFAGCLGLSIAACTDGDAHPVGTGALGETPDAPEGEPADAPASEIDARPGDPDARPGDPDAHPQPDAMPGTPDASGGPTCGANATDVGAASTFTTNTPTYFSTGSFFVVRDRGGLYALSSKCTHEGATVNAQSTQFYCPRHGAKFTFNGDIISGPVFNPLAHYAMCILSNGNVGVVTSQKVAASTRLAV